jgi:hypothetical protein
MGFFQQLEVLPANVAALANGKDQVNFIDKFFVPADAKKEFLERTAINRNYIKTLPGFIRDAAYSYTDNEGNLICVTVAQWENIEAVNKAKEAVQALYKQQGFDPPAMFKRLHITMDRGIYTVMEK